MELWYRRHTPEPLLSRAFHHSSKEVSVAEIYRRTPLYNKADTISRAIGSVLSQSATDCEIIVVDDGSTDGSVEAIDKAFLPSIKLVQAGQCRTGQGAQCREPRWPKANSSTFLDADDEWEPGFPGGRRRGAFAARRLRRLCRRLLLGRHEHVQEDISAAPDPALRTEHHRRFRKPSDIKNYVDCFHSSSTVVRREAFQRCGGYFERDRCLYGEDSYFWLQIALVRTGLLRSDEERPASSRRGLQPRDQAEGPASAPAGARGSGASPGKLPAGAPAGSGRAACLPTGWSRRRNLVGQGKFHETLPHSGAFPWPPGAVDSENRAPRGARERAWLRKSRQVFVSSARDDSAIDIDARDALRAEGYERRVCRSAIE